MRVRTPLTLSAMAAAAAALALTGSLPAPVSGAVHVHDGVHRTLQERGRVSIVLTMKEQRPDDILQPGGGNREADTTTAAPSSSSSKEVRKESDNSTLDPQGVKKTTDAKATCMDNDGGKETRDADTVADDADASAAAAAVVDQQQVQELVDRLVQYAEEKHQEVMEVIKEDAANTTTPESGKARSLWITNEVYIRDATPELIEKLKEVPSLGSIREEVIARLSIQESRAVAMDETNFVGEWGLERIQALDAWKLGYLGRNVRVGTIDSGVRVTHEALSANYVGDYGWYDPISKSKTPNDPGDHGTAVMGLLAGGQGFGVAPKAQWMSCRACDATQRCREGDLLECAQFMTCPFLDGDKTKTDCSKKPHIINNSWNSERGVDAFDNAINVWISAGIIPVFSNGNNGPGCGTVNSPADSTIAITVGSTDYDDLLSGFSGRGPGLKGEIKPDLTAPGEYVVAPGSNADSAISVYQGTSFAAPHVAGAIALLLEAFPGLSTSQVKTLLMQNTDTSVLSVTSQPTCGTLNAASQFPNNAFGYGRVNIFKAINAQKAAVAAASAAATSVPPAPSPAAASFSSAGANASTPTVAAASSSSSAVRSASRQSGSGSSSGSFSGSGRSIGTSSSGSGAVNVGDV